MNEKQRVVKNRLRVLVESVTPATAVAAAAAGAMDQELPADSAAASSDRG